MAMTSVVIALVAGCSTDSEPVDSVLSRQLNAAEGVVFSVLQDEGPDTGTFRTLVEELSKVVTHWDEQEEPSQFLDSEGTAVFYNDRTDAFGDDSSFDVFVASGRSDRTTLGWFGSTPNRVYTCYRIEVSFEAGELTNFHRSRDFGEGRLECPTKLVSALGHGAQYREPWLFDG